MVALVDVEPALGRLVGVRAAARIGHDPALPVLDVGAGPWAPGRPPAALALAVLQGLVRTADRLFGPGDRFAPWIGTERWTACTDVRVAVLGTELVTMLRAWPALARRLADRRGPALVLHAMPEGDDEQLLNLLWRIAQQWGTVAGEEIVMPAVLDAGVLTTLSGGSPTGVVAALGRLAADGPLEMTAGRPWQLHGRDDLRAQVARGLAFARATGEVFAAVSTISDDGAA